MKRTLVSSLVALLITFITIPAFAQRGGVVADGAVGEASTEGRCADIEIRLCDADGKVVSMMKTKADGSFSFRCPSSGEYSLVVTDRALESARVAINTKGTGAEKGRVAIKTKGTGADKNRTASQGEEASSRAHSDIFLDIDDDCDGISAVLSPRDAASGLPTGKRQHKPMTFVKDLDKSTPILMCSKEGATVRGHIGYNVKENVK
jgi:hypothetical protein